MAAKMKKVPLRMCVGCREMKPKKELVRIVRNKEGEISIDYKGKAPGRGAYLCHHVDCLTRAKRSKALERALEHKIEQEIYLHLEQEMAACAVAIEEAPDTPEERMHE